MTLTKPNLDLRNDLRAAALALETVAQDLFIATKSSTGTDFDISMERIRKLYEHIDKLMLRADQVAQGLITLSSSD